jgi:hypothetical protein
MVNIIDFKDINLDYIAEILTESAIDVDRTYDDCLYVTGGAFPVFWSIESNREALVFWTFLDALDNGDEDQCVRFANACNLEFNMVQFSYNITRCKFYGHHVLFTKEGLNRKQMIRTGRRFGSIFAKAAAMGVAKRLLQPLDDDDAPASGLGSPQPALQSEAK